MIGALTLDTGESPQARTGKRTTNSRAADIARRQSKLVKMRSGTLNLSGAFLCPCIPFATNQANYPSRPVGSDSAIRSSNIAFGAGIDGHEQGDIRRMLSRRNAGLDEVA